MSTHYQKASGSATHEDLIFRKRGTRSPRPVTAPPAGGFARGTSGDADEALHEPARRPVDGHPLGPGRPVTDAHRGVDRQDPRRMAQSHVAAHGRTPFSDPGPSTAAATAGHPGGVRREPPDA